MLTSVNFEGSRATGSVFQLFQKPGAVGCSMRKHTYTRDGRNTRGCSVLECKIELTYVKLGAAYYGMCSARPSDTNIIEKSAVRTTSRPIGAIFLTICMFLYNRHCPPHLRMRHVLRNSKYPDCLKFRAVQRCFTLGLVGHLRATESDDRSTAATEGRRLAYETNEHQ